MSTSIADDVKDLSEGPKEQEKPDYSYLDTPRFWRNRQPLSNDELIDPKILIGAEGFNSPATSRRQPELWKEIQNDLGYGRSGISTLPVDPSTLSEEELDKPAYLRQSRERE